MSIWSSIHAPIGDPLLAVALDYDDATGMPTVPTIDLDVAWTWFPLVRLWGPSEFPMYLTPEQADLLADRLRQAADHARSQEARTGA